MKTRRLSKSGPELPVVGLGCMGMSEFYGPSDEQTSIGVIHRALEVGINFFDTADMYGTGHNEALLGRALRGQRDRAIIATKFAIQRGANGSVTGISGKPEYVREACDASLKRLGIETIDLYYQHRVDPEVPIEDTVGAMGELVKAGKVRALGMSEAAPETIRRAHREYPIAALQTEYSLWSREPEGELLDTCRELGITFVAYSPLGRGFLTGKIRSQNDLAATDYRKIAPRFTAANLEKNMSIVGAIETIAAKRGCTPAQLALAWVISRAPFIVTIPGTRSTARLEENAAAAELALDASELAAIDKAIPKDAASGGRYPEASMKYINK